MTILCTIAREVEPIAIVPTALDREHAAMTSPFAAESQADEPTPLTALGDAPRPRYETRVCGRGDRPRDGYFVWDLQEDGPVAWHRWLTDAHKHAEDANAEDGPDCGAWWNALPSDAELDAQWSLTLAGGRASATRLDPDEDARACGLA